MQAQSLFHFSIVFDTYSMYSAAQHYHRDELLTRVRSQRDDKLPHHVRPHVNYLMNAPHRYRLGGGFGETFERSLSSWTSALTIGDNL
jgi:hypothetical protein